MKLEQAKEVTKLRQEVEQGAKELASKYERKMKVCLCQQFPSLCPLQNPSRRCLLLHMPLHCCTLTALVADSTHLYSLYDLLWTCRYCK